VLVGALVTGTLVAGMCCAELTVVRPIPKDTATRATMASAINVMRIGCVRDFPAVTGAARVVVFMTSTFCIAGVGCPTRPQDHLGGGLESTVRLRSHIAHRESSSDRAVALPS
jgi:hypothetical protein